MRRFIFMLIALLAVLTIDAQAIRLDNASFINTCVVQQHIDVGVTIQTYNYISTFQVQFQSGLYSYYESVPTFSYTTLVMDVPCNTQPAYWHRDVGWSNNNSYSYNYIQTNNIIDATTLYNQNNYKNVQKYYCNE